MTLLVPQIWSVRSRDARSYSPPLLVFSFFLEWFDPEAALWLSGNVNRYARVFIVYSMRQRGHSHGKVYTVKYLTNHVHMDALHTRSVEMSQVDDLRECVCVCVWCINAFRLDSTILVSSEPPPPSPSPFTLFNLELFDHVQSVDHWVKLIRYAWCMHEQHTAVMHTSCIRMMLKVIAFFNFLYIFFALWMKNLFLRRIHFYCRQIHGLKYLLSACLVCFGYNFGNVTRSSHPVIGIKLSPKYCFALWCIFILL